MCTVAEAAFNVVSASLSQCYSWGNTAFFQVGKHSNLDRV